MQHSHGYRAFGLNILSCLEIPHWAPGAPPWDVVIERGEVPRSLPGAEELWEGRFQGRAGVCIIDFAHAGRMLIEAGRRVVIEPAPDGVPAWFITLLATTGFAAVIYQRGGLCLHASAVAREGRAYLIAGPSGAGKSTTASALLKHGCHFVSDDVTMITPRPGGGFDATASHPTVRLNADSHAVLDLGASTSGELREDLDQKFQLRYLGLSAKQPQRIARICFLENDPEAERPRGLPMFGQERVGALQRSFFRRAMGRIVADPARLAALSIALAQEVDVVRLTRPTSGFVLDELCALVLA